MEMYIELRNIAEELLNGTGKTFKTVMKDLLGQDPDTFSNENKYKTVETEENIEKVEQIFRNIFYQRMLVNF
jgi:DNA replication initiation complex subunit (GINS family)